MKCRNAVGVMSIVFGMVMACGTSKPPTSTAIGTPDRVLRNEAPPASPGIEFRIEPGDAEVYVDGERLGSARDVAAGGVLELSAGLHQIMIRHDVLKTYRVEVSIGDTTEKITVNLEAAE